MALAIVGSSGGMKGIFVQGVLNAFEAAGLRADAYAGASASALPAISAAAGLCHFVQHHYWQRVQIALSADNTDLSQVMHAVTQAWNSPDEPFVRELFKAGQPRLLIPANHVHTEEAAAQTQSEQARRLGRKLLIAAKRGDRSWVEANLALHLYATHGTEHQLTPDTLAQVAYASTCMIQWRVPAWINDQPYVDASYTCALPAAEVVALGYTQVIAISTEVGAAYRDIFADTMIPDAIGGVPIHFVRPAYDLASVGVDFTTCSDEGLLTAFQHGEAQGRAFLETWPQ